MTLFDVLQEAATILAASPHPENARRDAEFLLLHTLGRDRAYLLTHQKDALTESNLDSYRETIRRRAAGEPIQYITGQQEFYGLNFAVRPGVLIPRPETEHLIEAVLVAADNYPSPRILDVGTGSGAIAIALAHSLLNATVTATDISPLALEIAHENAVRNGVEGKISFRHANLLSGLEGEQFDIIVSNPPYVALELRESLSVEVREYEPEVALFAGKDGFEIYRRLIPQAFERLAAPGWLFLEIGHGQSEEIQRILEAYGFEEVLFHPDLQGIPRVAQGRKLL